MPLSRRNVAMNGHVARAAGGRAEAVELPWGEGVEAALKALGGAHANVVLACEIVCVAFHTPKP